MATLTLIHVALSLVGIAAGFVVMGGLIAGKRLDGWTALFLATTVLTSVTGFLFPIEKFTPGLALGILSLVVLVPALLARYRFRLAGAWRPTYVVTALVAQYFNVVVLVVQSFQKVPSLRELAPTQSEPPFLVTQLVVLALFVAAGAVSLAKFRVGAVTPPEDSRKRAMVS